MKEKGEPVYIDKIPYEDFVLLGQVDMEKRFGWAGTAGAYE